MQLLTAALTLSYHQEIEEQEQAKRNVRAKRHKEKVAALARCKQSQQHVEENLALKQSPGEDLALKDPPPKLTAQEWAARNVCLAERASLLELESASLTTEIGEYWKEKMQEKLTPSFEASASFQGYMDGYFYSLGDEGLGYYPDMAMSIESQSVQFHRAEIAALDAELAAAEVAIESAKQWVVKVEDGCKEVLVSGLPVC
jgi:hypothetical protein